MSKWIEYRFLDSFRSVLTVKGVPCEANGTDASRTTKKRLSQETKQHSITIHMKHMTIESSMVSVSPTLQTKRLVWQADDGDFPVVSATGKCMRIPGAYLANSGVKAPVGAQDLILYKRRNVLELWREIQRDTVKHTAGKSSAIIAFACGHVDCSEWIVVWMNFNATDNSVECIKFDGDSKVTAKCFSDFSTWDAAWFSSDAFGVDPFETLVFFDGWVQNNENCAKRFAAVLRWASLDRKKRRVVCVASMASRRRLKPTTNIAMDRERPLPSLACVRDSAHDSEASEEDSSSYWDDRGGDVRSAMVFEVVAWRLEEYHEAVNCDEVFCSVKEALQIK